MVDIELVIKIPKELYEVYKGRPPQLGDAGMDMIAQSIANGKPLPKGRGDLIDTIKLKAKMFDLPQQPEGNYWDGVDAVGELIDNAPIVIEADKEN